MEICIVLTRIASESLQGPASYLKSYDRVKAELKAACPGVEWIGAYAVAGEVDFVDILRVSGRENLLRAAALVRSRGEAQLEIWPAMEWDRFHALLQADGAEEDRNAARTGKVGEASDESFPASDPPGWTGGAIT